MAGNVRPYAGACIGLILVVMLGACAAKTMNWQKTNVSPEEQGATLAQCRVFAARETERNFVRQQDNAASGAYGEQSTYQQNMASYQTAKDTNALLSRCMKLNGYRRVPASN